jgi:ribose/xylose/arabinose/galactoside ABC-type transport system permease subunit
MSGKDNATPDLGRHSWFICMIAVMAASIWNAVHTGVFDIEKLYMGLAAVVTAHGMALWAKQNTEPMDNEGPGA